MNLSDTTELTPAERDFIQKTILDTRGKYDQFQAAIDAMMEHERLKGQTARALIAADIVLRQVSPTYGWGSVAWARIEITSALVREKKLQGI